MESARHQALKQIARAYLLAGDACAAALEVRAPIGRWRVDVCAYADAPAGRRGLRQPQVTVVECKQARGDFFSDRADAEALRRTHARLDRQRRQLEEQVVMVGFPELRRSGSSLFPECEAWDFQRAPVPEYRALVRELRLIERRLHGGTKLGTLARYRLADALYLAAPRGLIAQGEVPPGWGLLEVPADVLAEATENAGAGNGDEDEGGKPKGVPLVDIVRVRVPAPVGECRADWRERWLRGIAVAATRETHPGAGAVPGDET